MDSRLNRARALRSFVRCCGCLSRDVGYSVSMDVPSSVLLHTSLRGFASAAGADSSKRGPVSYVSLALTMATGCGLYYWYEQKKMEKIQSLTSSHAVVAGQAALGGPFALIEAGSRKPFTEKELLGSFSLLYFGFTHCPDICPDELEKIAEAVDLVGKDVASKDGSGVVPVFITVDPERDGPAQVEAYVKEFHPKMIGLTGTTEAVKEAAKAYRVYYTKATLEGADDSEEEDYLIDHSIITYLIDPDGKFVTFYGKNYTTEEMAASIAGHVKAWEKTHAGWKP